MLTDSLQEIGERLYALRKKRGLTQLQVSLSSGISERTYPEIERGLVNMRILTFVRICETLGVSADDVLLQPGSSLSSDREDALFDRVRALPLDQRTTALRLLEVYLDSVER